MDDDQECSGVIEVMPKVTPLKHIYNELLQELVKQPPDEYIRARVRFLFFKFCCPSDSHELSTRCLIDAMISRLELLLYRPKC